MRNLTLLTLALSGCAADVAFNCLGDAPMCEIYDVTTDDRKRASGLEITSVEFSQAVNLDLIRDGLAVEQVVPVAAGRDGVFRIHVTPTPDWQVRPITARVLLRQDDEVVGAAQADLTPITASSQSDLSSTFNVRVSGDMVPEGELFWEVELLEQAGEAGSGSNDGAIWPPRDRDPVAIEVGYNGPSLRVYLVPIQWDVDGSGQLPDTNPDTVERYRAAMMQVYPVADVEIEVGEPLSWNFPAHISSDMLGAVAALRAERDIDDRQYIYGILNPTDGMRNPSGLGMLGSPAAIGYSYDVSGGAGDTIIHEIGHNHGLAHAPCGGAAGPDPNFPYDEGGIGVYGYDLATDTLVSPDVAVDMMGYCSPRWISDYYYDRVFNKSEAMWDNFGDGEVARMRTQAWRPVWLHSDGGVEQAPLEWLAEAPQGETREVMVEGELVTGVFAPFYHVEGGVLYVPGQGAIDALRVDDGPLLTVEQSGLR